MDINEKCLSWWDAKLKEGAQIPVTGGSDFHKIEFERMIASPCTCLYAWSRTGKDLLDALRAGHGFVTYSPTGPMAEATAGEWLMGDRIDPQQEIEWKFWNLREGDQIVFISDTDEQVTVIPPDVQEYHCSGMLGERKYLRAEVRRKTGAAGEMPAMLTNPFYKK